MIATQQFSGAIANRVGISEELALALVVALLRTLPWLCQRDPPEVRLKRAVLEDPERVAKRIARLARRQHIAEPLIVDLQLAVIQAVVATDLATLKVICSENLD